MRKKHKFEFILHCEDCFRKAMKDAWDNSTHTPTYYFRKAKNETNNTRL